MDSLSRSVRLNQIFSQIYCDGPILKAVQDAHLYPDSKHFVDMPLKYDPGMEYFCKTLIILLNKSFKSKNLSSVKILFIAEDTVVS